jgi:hypothetical protein
LLKGLTARYLLKEVLVLRPGDTVLYHAPNRCFRKRLDDGGSGANRYDITFDPITQDSTQFNIAEIETCVRLQPGHRLPSTTSPKSS